MMAAHYHSQRADLTTIATLWVVVTCCCCWRRTPHLVLGCCVRQFLCLHSDRRQLNSDDRRCGFRLGYWCWQREISRSRGCRQWTWQPPKRKKIPLVVILNFGLRCAVVLVVTERTLDSLKLLHTLIRRVDRVCEMILQRKWERKCVKLIANATLNNFDPSVGHAFLKNLLFTFFHSFSQSLFVFLFFFFSLFHYLSFSIYISPFLPSIFIFPYLFPYLSLFLISSNWQLRQKNCNCSSSTGVFISFFFFELKDRYDRVRKVLVDLDSNTSRIFSVYSQMVELGSKL